MESPIEGAWREALMSELQRRAAEGDGTLSRSELTAFTFGDRMYRLIDESRGIRNPKDMSTTLTITHNPSGPYRDVEVSPGVWEYAYQRGSIEGSNTKLRRAWEDQIPVLFLLKLETNVFVPVSLARVVADDRQRRVFTVALEEVADLEDHTQPAAIERAYAERVVRQRLHQPAFRGMVLRAYNTHCAVCELRHGALLDAAHIVPDREVLGVASASNGLSLCKLHHAAYDHDMLGVSPDYRVTIRRDLLTEIDGPMLRHGIQEMHGRTIGLPVRVKDRPDRELLAWRWERFAQA